jgi:hypothetical protein
MSDTFGELALHPPKPAYGREITLYLTHTLLQPVVHITIDKIYYIAINRTLLSSSSTEKSIKSITWKIYAKYMAGAKVILSWA